jgi:opacity protein-like surface antigen
MLTRNLQRTWLSGILLVAVALGLPAAAPADTAAVDDAYSDTGWRLRFYAAAIDFDDNTGQLDRGGYGIDVGGGLGVNAEYRFSRRLGLDLGVIAGGGVDIQTRPVHYGSASWYTHDTLSFTPLTAGLDIHLTPDNRVDLYVCPLVALIQYGGLVVRSGPGGVTTHFDLDSDFGVGAALGIAVPFHEQAQWSFNANLLYLDSSLDGNSQNGLRLDGDYDATIFGLGVGYRF